MARPTRNAGIGRQPRTTRAAVTKGSSSDSQAAWVARVALIVAGPVLFLAVAEGLLGLSGFGGRPPLFVPSASLPGMLETNDAIAQRYFPGRETELAIEPIAFLADKPTDAIRLVVQGGSTAAGFPYGRFAGLAGMLGDRLEAARPHQWIEVTTTAMAAVNSYTLLDFVDEIIEVEPDAVLIYAGHNEYLGILGAGSALTAQRSRAATRLHLALGQFRTYQLLDLLIPSAVEVSKARDSHGASFRSTLMARAARSSEIALDSDLYREGLLQFEENLGSILASYRAAQIPVFVATLASNEVDQPPFVGGPVSGEARERYAAELDGIRRLGQLEKWGEARVRLESLVARFPDAGDGYFELARAEHALEELDAARAHYRRAKELDRLRFRAPEANNEIIRRLAAEHGARLVDVQAHLEAKSELGRIGRDLMLEHLHPNALGYFLLADAYYRELEASGLLGPPPATPPPSTEQAFRDMPITAIDHLNAAQRVREITSDFPFREARIEVPYPKPTGAVEEIAREVYEEPSRWLTGMDRLLQHHLDRGEIAQAIVVARVTARLLPGEAAPHRAAALLLAQSGRSRQAVLYNERALRAEPDDLATLRRLHRLRSQLGDADEAALLARRIERIEATKTDVTAAETSKKGNER